MQIKRELCDNEERDDDTIELLVHLGAFRAIAEVYIEFRFV